ncbi:MAG: class I SAM-dependent methyltransferase [Planctomycetaceae bacterium]
MIESNLFHPDVLRELRQLPNLFETISTFKGKELGLQKLLRAEFDDYLVRAALLITDLRKRGAVKFSRADQMWFDRVGLEQSTSEQVANYKAPRFHGDVIDICSGIGGDSIAMARHANVTSIDRVEARGLCLQWNAKAYGVDLNVETREASPDTAAGKLVHIDPDRRAGARGRSLRIDDLEPGPDFLNSLMQKARGGAIKLSPASNFRGHFDDCEVELISFGGECKEATVWFGDLKSEHSARATVVETGETISGDLSYDMAEVSAPLRYVFDPDPALVRSGLLDQFALQHGLFRLDAEEEYLTADELPDSQFARGRFEVLANLSNDAKSLRKYVRENNVGRIEIKSRRVAVDVEKLRRSLKLKGQEFATAVIARLDGAARILVGRRV